MVQHVGAVEQGVLRLRQLLRRPGERQQADDLVLTMNRAAEAAVGLAIVVGVFRTTRHANVDRLTTLKH